MRKHAHGLLWLGWLLIQWPSAQALQSVTVKPLNQVVTTPLSPVVAGKTTTLPFITWGGDTMTLWANGGGLSTATSSIFEQHGLSMTLTRKDSFTEQLDDYLSGKTPYLRGTLGMILAASPLLRHGAKPIIVYQLSWSNGGDALVVSEDIRRTKDLKGKRIGLQAYGPHVDYAARILADAGLSFRDVDVVWLPDLTGTENTPAAAFASSTVDAAFVITPDAQALTSGGVGTGAEGSVKGARILLSTATANKVIADVYAVRRDYFQQHRDRVEALVAGLIEAEAALRKAKTKPSSRPWQRFLTQAAKHMLDSELAVDDMLGLLGDAELLGKSQNQAFFNDSRNPRGFRVLTEEVQVGLIDLGLLSQPEPLEFGQLTVLAGLNASTPPPPSRFQPTAVARYVDQHAGVDDGELFTFEVNFSPNQHNFNVEHYRDEYERAVTLASTYGGALITIEGHGDPLNYLKQKKAGASPVVLGRIKQSLKNLSYTRAQQVRDGLMAFARERGLVLDDHQFVTVGHGLSQPKTGRCGAYPCAPTTKQAWLSNLRVAFRILQVESELDNFSPL